MWPGVELRLSHSKREGSEAPLSTHFGVHDRVYIGRLEGAEAERIIQQVSKGMAVGRIRASEQPTCYVLLRVGPWERHVPASRPERGGALDVDDRDELAGDIPF